MKFGKTDLKPEEIDLSIPPLEFIKENTSALNELKIFTGQPVWSAKGNVGKIYPKGTKAANFLYHYSRQFNAIELNATYYKIPSQAQVLNWSSQTPEDFRFCPKFPQFISHRKKLSEKSAALDEFLENIYGFEDKLGISFLQLAPHFGPANIEDLKKFVLLLPEDMKFAIEFRHPDWFTNQDTWKDMNEFMHFRNVASAISDTPGRRDVLHMHFTNQKAIIRFKGHNLHPSDYTRTDIWIERTIEMVEKGINEIYFFLHQEDESLGIELSQHYVAELNKRLNKNFRFPQNISNQTELF